MPHVSKIDNAVERTIRKEHSLTGRLIPRTAFAILAESLKNLHILKGRDHAIC